MSNVEFIGTFIDGLEQELIQMRRHLHAHPELSFKEYETSKYVKSVLQKYAIRYTDGYVETGIVAEIGSGNGPVVFLRADMDALPIEEKNNCSYRSTTNGIMHACGHDVHTTCALGAAIALKKMENELSGTVKIIFQPGEEVLPGGASLMIKEGALGKTLPDAIVGLHVFPEMEVGNLGFRSGEYMASSDEIMLKVIGKGGHAAMKAQYNNPLIIASEILLQLNDYFSDSNTAKLTKNPTVLAFGKIEGKGATNVIPDEVNIEGTFRAMDEAWREVAHKAIMRITNEVAAKYNAKCETDIRKGYPVLKNNEKVTEICRKAASTLLPEANIHDMAVRMTAEDFAYYSQVIPSCFFRLGTRNTEKGIVSPVHTATFNIDEKALVIGAKAMAVMATELLVKPLK